MNAPSEAVADDNSYFLISGEGYPRIFDEKLPDSVADLQDCKVFDRFVICIDADEFSPAERLAEVNQYLAEYLPEIPKRTEVKIVIQSRCFESWFLGNRSLFPKNPQCLILRQYIAYYNVQNFCPELMNNNGDFSTTGAFHGDYLNRMFRERRLTYSKQFPGEVQEYHYLENLVDRTRETVDLNTFREFIEFCRYVRAYSAGYRPEMLLL